jgi:hypothetical protein
LAIFANVYLIHADRMTGAAGFVTIASPLCPAAIPVSVSSFSRIPMLTKPCRAAWA